MVNNDRDSEEVGMWCGKHHDEHVHCFICKTPRESNVKITQPAMQFTPITIKLDKRTEAEAFFSLLFKVEDNRCSADTPVKLNDAERRVLISLCDAYTTQQVSV